MFVFLANDNIGRVSSQRRVLLFAVHLPVSCYNPGNIVLRCTSFLPTKNCMISEVFIWQAGADCTSNLYFSHYKINSQMYYLPLLMPTSLRNWIRFWIQLANDGMGEHVLLCVFCRFKMATKPQFGSRNERGFFSCGR